MKRMLTFQTSKLGYVCVENKNTVFEISKADLQFDVKAFYCAFFAGEKDFTEIEIENMIQDDKDANRVYQCIVQLVNNVSERLKAELIETSKSDKEN